MTGTLSPPPLFQAFNTSGAFLVGGLLYTYIAGTSTPQATYTDSTLGTPNTNPIVLNAMGEAAVWLTPGLSYKFVLTDAVGNAYWTVDQINAALTFGSIGSSLIPTITNTYNIGSSSFTWANGYFGTAVYIAGIPAVSYVRTTSEIDASVTPTNYLYPEGNVLRYGADPTGVTPSDSAIRQMVAVIVANCLITGGVSGLGNHVEGVMPHGQYTITTTNVFGNPLFPTIIRGAVIRGDGFGATTLYLQTGGATTLWLFDATSTGGSAGTHPGIQNMLFWVFRDLCFTSDNAAYANGFNAYADQGVHFEDCYFNQMDVAIATNAASGQGLDGDSWEFFGCKWTNIAGACISYNNNQAFNFQFHGCDMESIQGYTFKVGTNGGGGMIVSGGSYISNGTNLSYFLGIVAGASLADSNNIFTFNGLYISLDAQTSCLVFVGATGDEAPLITFNQCSIQETGGSAGKQTVSNTEGHLVFNGCALTSNQGSEYLCYGPSAGGAQYGDPGSIIFNQCEVPINLSTLCLTPVGADSLSWGYVSARDCFASSYTSGTTRNIRTAIDFDLNWQNQGRASNGPRLKRAMITVQNYAWPASGGSFATWYTALPIGAIPVKIEAFRLATATNSAYSVAVGNQTTANFYGTATGTNTNVNTVFSWDQTDTPANWTPVTSSTNQITLTATGGTDAGVQTSVTALSNFAWVDYY